MLTLPVCLCVIGQRATKNDTCLKLQTVWELQALLDFLGRFHATRRWSLREKKIQSLKFSYPPIQAK